MNNPGEAEATTPAEVGGQAATVTPTAAQAPIKVRVIDDELAGLTFAHLTADTDNITQAFADISSPEVEELWPIVVVIDHSFQALDAERSDTVLRYLSSTEFVQKVLLSDHFRATASPLLMDPLARFFQRVDAVNRLKAQIEAAFPAPEFETSFADVRPSAPAELLAYDFLILDLVLQNSGGAVDEIVNYLLALGNVNYPAEIPGIIVLSNSDELINERLRFSTESQISAAGLLLLPKAKVRQADFGTSGLILSYQQLERQRGVAQHMRVFMRAWMDALEEARTNAKTTLWNLDAAAMQQIHLSAVTEDDPYDEHLNELMSREYLWHVESSPTVGKVVDALDECFTAQFKPSIVPPVIGTRFIAPLVQPKVGRDLVSHFTWTGFPVPQALDSISPEEALKNFNRLVPFGAVLAPKDLTAESECLVHITQQCDLNAATRAKSLENPVHTAQFAVVLPIEVVEHRMPSHDSESLVARGLTIGGKEYDFKLAKGRQLAMRIQKFIKYASDEKLSVVGRLRHDIATHFLSATTNHMTRFASLKTTRVEVHSAHVFLYGKKFPDSKPVMLKNIDGAATVVQFALHDKLYFFQDDTSIRLALWIKEQLTTPYPQVLIDASVVCNTLSVGLSKNQALIKIVDFVPKSFALVDLAGNMPADKAPDGKIQLVVVAIPQAAEALTDPPNAPAAV